MAPTESSKIEKESCVQSLNIGCLVSARSILFRCQATAFLGSMKEKPAEAPEPTTDDTGKQCPIVSKYPGHT